MHFHQLEPYNCICNPTMQRAYSSQNVIDIITVMSNNRPCQKGDNKTACGNYTKQKHRSSQNFIIPPGTGGRIISLFFEFPEGITIDVWEDIPWYQYGGPIKFGEGSGMGADQVLKNNIRPGEIVQDISGKGNFMGRSFYIANPTGATAPFPVTVKGNYMT